jgi:hypothetical protein
MGNMGYIASFHFLCHLTVSGDRRLRGTVQRTTAPKIPHHEFDAAVAGAAMIRMHTAMAALRDREQTTRCEPVANPGRYIGGGSKFSNADARQGSGSRRLFFIVDRSARHAAMIAAGLLPGQIVPPTSET